MSEPLNGSAKLILARDTNGPWRLEWPGHIQTGAFASLTHDELVRFGLSKALSRRGQGAIEPVRIEVEVRIREVNKQEAEHDLG